MDVIKSTDCNSKKLFYFIILGSFLWGLIVIPLFLELFDNISISIEILFLSVLGGLLATILPIYFGFHKPSKGKEHIVLFYPFFTIPLLFIMLKVRLYLMN
jgi:hypothetical protein